MLCDPDHQCVAIKLEEQANEIMDAVCFRGSTQMVVTTKKQMNLCYDLEDKTVKEMKKGIDCQWECHYSV